MPHYRAFEKPIAEPEGQIAALRRPASHRGLIIGGIGRLSGYSCVVIGNEKGSDTEGRVKRNFGVARPEGYRKAQRLMRLAERFHLPVVALVDTPGAYPGIDAEAGGQAEAIAR